MSLQCVACIIVSLFNVYPFLLFSTFWWYTYVNFVMKITVNKYTYIHYHHHYYYHYHYFISSSIITIIINIIVFVNTLINLPFYFPDEAFHHLAVSGTVCRAVISHSRVQNPRW